MIRNIDYEESVLSTGIGGIPKSYRPIRPISPIIKPISGLVKRIIQDTAGSQQTPGADPSGKNGVPRALLSLTAVQTPVANQAIVDSAVTVSFTIDPSDTNYDHVNIWLTGYHSNTNAQLVASTSAAPTTFIVDATGETVSVFAQTVSSSGANAPINFAAQTTVLLNGQAGNPPAPTIVQNLTATPLGYQFSFSQVLLPVNDTEVISAYRVYRNTSANTFAGSTLNQTIAHDPTALGAVVVQDNTGEEKKYYYFVTSVNSMRLESSATAAQSVTVGSGVVVRSVGKNMVANPSFESNTVGTIVGADIAIGAAISDGWQVSTKSAYHTTFLYGAIVRSGALAILSRLNQSVTVPNDSVFYDNSILTSTKLPVSIGDILRVSAWEYWANTAAIPAGVTILQRIALLILDATGAFLGALISDVTNGGGGFNAWYFQQAALQIPATLGGSVPAFAKFQCATFVKNAGAGGFSTGSNLYADCYFDDVKCVIQNTAFDLTPLNTSGTFTGATPLSQSGVTTTILVAASTMQFGDGQIVYSSGSVNPGALGTWYIYVDDPTYSGGAVTYVATASPSNTYAANGRIYFGVITTAGGGGGTGSGGGSGGGRLLLK